jgi:hypothetical protein
MDAIRNRLEQDLKVAVSRLRQLGGVKALEDLLGPSGEHWSFADEVDEIQANERREIGFATASPRRAREPPRGGHRAAGRR